MKRTLALALTLAAGVALAQSVKLSVEGAAAYNCAGASCDLGPFDTARVAAFSCYVANGSDAARNVTVTLYRDDGTTLAASVTLSCPASTACAVTVGPGVEPTAANAAGLPVTPTRWAKATVAAGGSLGSATITCIGR